MAVNIDKALGIYPQTLALRTKRAEILANNIANQDTPGFKSRDIDFQQMLANATSSLSPSKARTTHMNHKSGLIDSSGFEGLKFRNAVQPSIDGNTVDAELEKAEYAKNSLRFDASFNFLNGTVKGIMGAIRGE